MAETIRVLFGTETGTAEMCASDLVDNLKKKGWPATLVDMDDVDADTLGDEHMVVVITSTFGNGDPPANAENLLDSLRDDRPDLSGLPYAVMALGDSSYPRFAQCGKDFFAIFGELGGEAVIERVDADGDVDAPFAAFQKNLIGFLENNTERFPRGEITEEPKQGIFTRIKSWFGGSTQPPADSRTTRPPTPEPTPPPQPTRHNPGIGKLVAFRLLSKPGSTKETRHYTVDLGEHHGLVPGDSLGVFPRNASDVVEAILEAIELDGSAPVTTKQQGSTTLSEALATRCLRRVPAKLLEACGPDAARTADSPEALQRFGETHHVLHALRTFRPQLDAQQLVDALHPLAPRLYSVTNEASSGIVDLVIETLRYDFEGVPTKGVASCWFADQLQPGDTFPWYPQPNKDFHLPEGDAPLIFIGPGTGIAPFRGMLQQLATDNAQRQTWLFFGHRHSAFDDLYGDELKQFLGQGVLSELSLAWSRDQDQRVYVQDRIRARAEEVWSWLEDGAIIMVCGAAVGMAPGVRSAFMEIAQANGENGEEWLASMREEGRYREDVY